ncbi:MAG: type III-A CRISPR-associated RAMP protein Csm4 [Bacteroidales bacterium]|jgi:CRISPR-associated protein Csm4|nr:type III-A CRISPR-associated RAMP protein Csm4 [Bacteroidales bacterium]
MKEQYQIYKLRFTTAVHFSDERDDYSKSLVHLHSDSLQAALLSVLASAGYDVPPDGDTGFVVSSLFPYYQEKKDSGEDAVYFFPRPQTNEAPGSEMLSYLKTIKNIKWLDQHYFQKLLKGEQLFSNMLDPDSMKGEFLTDQKLPQEGMYVRQQQARVAVPRQYELDGHKKDAEPFYMERIYFSDYSGLYFIAKGNSETFELLEKGLNILKSEGLGTDRTVGNGFFEWEQTTISLEVKASEYAMNLSMYLPEDEMILKQILQKNQVAYDFMKRGGWITTPPYSKLRKNSIYMLTEGSILHTGQQSALFVKGRIADLKPQIEALTPNHAIYRNGKSLFIPIKPVKDE